MKNNFSERIYIYVGLVLTVLFFIWLSGAVLLMLTFSFDAPGSRFFDRGVLIRLLIIAPLLLPVGVFIFLCKKLKRLNKTQDKDKK